MPVAAGPGPCGPARASCRPAISGRKRPLLRILTSGDAMDVTILAHQGGWDEMLIFASPVAMGIGLWVIFRQKPAKDEGEDDSPELG